MKYCPNVDCSYARKFKRPGEYADTASTCSDCGAELTAVAPVLPVSAPAAEVVKPSDANRRLLITLCAGLAQLVLARLPVFGAPASLFGGAQAPLRMLAAGMVPFVAAFLLVEGVALVLPPLRAVRVGGARARAGLDRLAWGLGALFLGLQLFTLTRYAESAGGVPPAGLLWAQLGLAHLAMLGLAVLVNRAGLGNGFALLLALAPLAGLPETGRAFLEALQSESIAPLPVLVIAVALLGVAMLSMHLGREGRGKGEALPSAAPAPVSSTVGWSAAVAAMALPSLLAAWRPEARWVEAQLRTSVAVYFGLFIFVAVDAALVVGVLSFRPRAVGRIWARWVPGVDEIGVVAAARALLPRALAVSVGLTVGLPFLMMVLNQVAALGVSSTVVLLVIVGACAFADVQDEWRALRRLGPLSSVWEVQRTAEVEPILHRLRGVGIEGHASSFLVRATQQFFAPWIPVRVLVPVARAEEARALLSK